ncbi:uncharacterized protein [Ptychodera flava]|uniref:uncharacterized protein isoform X2 n=1 Tax=Ptychodera flava TaxID=63121 RepID=UPI00396A9629
MWKLGLWMSIESDDDVESRDDSMEQEDATPAENQGLVCGLMEADLKPSEHLYAEQITMAEYQKQSEEYTKQCLQQLLNSEEYQRIYKTCSSCNACWYDEQASPGCAECGDGGYAITRPCAICCGKCQQIWTRDIDMEYESAHSVADNGMKPNMAFSLSCHTK